MVIVVAALVCQGPTTLSDTDIEIGDRRNVGVLVRSVMVAASSRKIARQPDGVSKVVISAFTLVVAVLVVVLAVVVIVSVVVDVVVVECVVVVIVTVLSSPSLVELGVGTIFSQCLRQALRFCARCCSSSNEFVGGASTKGCQGD